jgi:hypothetical protein
MLKFFFRYKTRGISHQPLDPSYRNLVWMQATLADSFLADLEDLSDNEVLDEEGDHVRDEVLDSDEEMATEQLLSYEDLDTVAKLQKSQRYHDIMKVQTYNHFQNWYMLAPGRFNILQLLLLRAGVCCLLNQYSLNAISLACYG